jgi:fatty acid desaturase
MRAGPSLTIDTRPRRRDGLRWLASLVLHVALLTLALLGAGAANASFGWMAAAVVFGFASVQIGFLGHDLDHGQVPIGRRRRRILGLLCWNVLLGVSHGWWRDKHLRHHRDTHRPGHDPDLFPLFAHEVDAARAMTGPHRWFVAWQSWLFWPVTAFARAWFQWLSLCFVARLRGRDRLAEGLTLALQHVLFWSLAWSVLGRAAIGFALVSQAVCGLYMGLAFSTNHLGLPHAAERRSGRLWQIAHTRNIRSGRFGDYLLGGLNLQIEHHVHPGLARRRLRAQREPVQQWCRANGMPYRETGLWTALREVHAELERVARAARRA